MASPTPVPVNQPNLRALGAGTYSNTASTVTYSDLFPTGHLSTSTASDGSVVTTSAAADSSEGTGGRNSQTLYLIIFLSILCILLIASTLIAIRAIALRRRYRTEIQRALARGELPPFQSAFVDPSSGRTTLEAFYGLPRWTAFLFGFGVDMPDRRRGSGEETGRRRSSVLYGFGLGGVGDHFRGFQTGGMATERERQRRERKNLELPVMWEFGLEDEKRSGIDSEADESTWAVMKMPLDLARGQPISVSLLPPEEGDESIPHTQSNLYPPTSRTRSQSSSSVAPPLFTLSPLTESISRTLTRYTTNGSELTNDAGPSTANEVLTGRRRTSSGATMRDRLDWAGVNRDASYPDVVHEVANEDVSRGPSRNPSRRPSLSGAEGGNNAGLGAGTVSDEREIQGGRRDSVVQDGPSESSEAARWNRNQARTRTGRGGYGNVMSSRLPPGPPLQPSAHHRDASRTRELPTARPLTRSPQEGENVRVGFLIRMPEPAAPARNPQDWDEEEAEPGHGLMMIGLMDGQVVSREGRAVESGRGRMDRSKG